MAATKSFTSTVTAFALLALHLGRMRDLSPSEGKRIVDGLKALPAKIAEILELDDEIAEDRPATSRRARACCSSGGGAGWPVAREGAQKLKEISYIHAEAYASAELKHGPLALVSPELPTVAVVPDDDLFDKNTSTLAEIKARRGPVIAVAHRELPAELADRTIVVPKSEDELDPILMSVPLQILAYHAAVALEPRRRQAPQPRQERHRRVAARRGLARVGTLGQRDVTFGARPFERPRALHSRAISYRLARTSGAHVRAGAATGARFRRRGEQAVAVGGEVGAAAVVRGHAVQQPVVHLEVVAAQGVRGVVGQQVRLVGRQHRPAQAGHQGVALLADLRGVRAGQQRARARPQRLGGLAGRERAPDRAEVGVDGRVEPVRAGAQDVRADQACAAAAPRRARWWGCRRRRRAASRAARR